MSSPFRAHITAVWLFTGMHSNVFLQRKIAGKRFPACITDIRFMAKMSFQMILQIALVVKAARTLGASEWSFTAVQFNVMTHR